MQTTNHSNSRRLESKQRVQYHHKENENYHQNSAVRKIIRMFSDMLVIPHRYGVGEQHLSEETKLKNLKTLSTSNIKSLSNSLSIVIINKPGHPIPYAGGIERYSLELAKHLAKRDINVVLVSAFSSRRNSLINIGKLQLANALLPLHRIAREGSTLWFIHHIVGSFTHSLTALKHVVKIKASIVHVNDGFTALLMRLLRAATRLKFIIISSIHAPPPWEMNYGKHTLLIKITYILLYLAGMTKSDTVIGINPVICRSIERITKKCVFIPNALPDDVLTPNISEAEAKKIVESYGIDRDYYLFVGRLVPEKGIDRLLKIAYEYEYKYGGKDTIVIVGRGPLEKYVKRACKVLKNLRYVGFIPRNHLKAFYTKAKALLITSRAEGMPTVMLEALAHGTPVITTKFKGIEEISKLIGNKALIIVENPGRIGQLLTNSLSLRKLPEEVRRKVIEEFSWDTIARKVIQVYNISSIQ